MPSTQEKAKTITNELQTDYKDKKHGGYSVYEDAKIKISLDTYVPNWVIVVKLKDKTVTVASGGCNTPEDTNMIHGKWEEYFEALYQNALQAKERCLKKAIEETNRKQQEHEKFIAKIQEEMESIF